mmetsp:Transcript_53576/g.127694  ORF Transcript_53576/g.127694 Transcript_53576/m.127694 type:complete len:1243 (+) Transcript_53576:107-3835(+)|eukprot:CAMPEP_0178388246 /NCGR_PEP_ID=MMETSP0689_2-20121128/9490_1 /TAXON_ID=160604 /ORGANISM="Amphidinium massartii, Strain CS-259" /LENGTH=1242 /DNA_ID=CAMNT_0020008635 /DNA_START=33 /DNA_END=3761 /DNA_ORIENTATION=-
MGRVHEIVLENFKSYGGRVQVGPFHKFSCIIGPNGAGKSNLMDAISFVLGVQSRQLRSERMRDLVYRKECEDAKQNSRVASVELTYVAEGEFEPSELEAPADKKQVFKRSILKGGETRFQVDGQTVSQADYLGKLEAINILSKARNFLVFQGDVEATAQRQGKDLTAFFEQVSGSDAYRQEYEQLAAEKAKKEDSARYLFTKKRNAVNEKKRVTKQKEEAEEFQQLEEERKALQKEFYLFRLHGLERQLDNAVSRLTSIESEKADMAKAVDEERHTLEQAEREKAKAHLTLSQAERVASVTKSELDKLHPEHSTVRSRIQFLRQRVEDLQRTSHNSQKRHELFNGHTEALRKEAQELEEKIALLHRDVQEKELNFTPEQQAEFQKAQQEAERVTAASADRRQELENALRAARAERERSEREAHEASAQAECLNRRIAELTELLQGAEAVARRDHAMAQKQRAERESLKAKIGDCSDEKEQLQAERQELTEAIQDITATEQQLARERNISEVCSSLAATFQGVRGRVVDLCRPSQKRLHVAVNVALGKNADAVVVDTSETAHACVRFLKERMLEPMTFLPLQELRWQPMDARAQQLISEQPRLRLALNCVTFDESVARAIEFLLGEVAIADTLTDGRQLVFERLRGLGARCKVVTIAGETIAKNGNLGVNSEVAREGATRFDVTELDSTRSRVAEIDARLQAIHSLEIRGGADMAAMQDEIQRVELRSGESAAKFRRCTEQIQTKTSELQTAEKTLKSIQAQVSKMAAAETQATEELRKHEDSVGKATAGMFQQLSSAMGVEDVRKVHAEWQRAKEKADRESDVASRRLSNTRAELDMMEASLRETAARISKQQSVPALQAELQELTAKEKKLSTDVAAVTAKLQEQSAQVKACQAAEQERDRAVAARRQELKARRQQYTALEKTISDIVAQHKAAQEARTDELKRSVLEDCDIPLLEHGKEALQDIAAEPSQQRAATGSQRANAAVLEMSARIAIDFSGLPADKQAASAGPAAQMLTEEYKSELARLKQEMERRSPNLKSLNQMQNVVENLQNTSKEADQARKEIEAIETKFQEVRTARTKRFMDCFQAVSAEISNVYRRLTSSSNGQFSDGGSAYLDLEDTEEPYNGGIKYTAMPPGKRFRDMHLLSGGEKTLAAMALLFAVHAYQMPPFMIVDEIDAALDANNVQALVNYVEQAHCQMIVISLKDRFFTRGEALLGVWKNKPEETSSILSLNLQQYLPTQ